MGMTIDELITFCEEEEQNHRVKAKRADDASGYTRSKDKNIKTAVAIREEVYSDFYKQIADTMRKYQKIQADYENRLKADMVGLLKEMQDEIFKQSWRLECICDDLGGSAVDLDDINRIIQQKIDKLKEAKDGENND